jgi:transposase
MARKDDSIEKTHSRVWLNEKRGRAYTIVNTEFNRTSPPRYNNPSIDVYIDIADCSNTVCLDFSIDNLKDKVEINKVLKKIKRFREEFQKLEDEVLRAVEVAKDIPKFVRKK